MRRKIKAKIKKTILKLLSPEISAYEPEMQTLRQDLFYHALQTAQYQTKISTVDISKAKEALCSRIFPNMQQVLPHIHLQDYKDIKQEPDIVFLWGGLYNDNVNNALKIAIIKNLPVFIWENGFLRSAAAWGPENKLGKYTHAVSFVIDTVPYYDATQPSRLENMLNDKGLFITPQQRQRAATCIKKIISTHLTKYNHQPIYTPNIGRENTKKVLVVDQAYNDMSIIKGWGSEQTFKNMLQKAIDENPNADIIVKTHPDTMNGTRGGYYTQLKPHNNIYIQNTPINPISLIKYVDKVYVCSTQLGFEALMCGKEVHVFGMPFYAGWGLTIDEQRCERRTNKRSLEEVFYIAYILYTLWVDEEKGCRCEIEDAMEYLLKLRKEFFSSQNILNELDI